MTSFRWKCNACLTKNEVSVDKLLEGSNGVSVPCKACSNTTTINLCITTSLDKPYDSFKHTGPDGQRCFTCPFYRELDSSWDYGEAYGRCALDTEYDDNDYKVRGTVCCRNKERLEALEASDKTEK